jgi:signal peptidase I
MAELTGSLASIHLGALIRLLSGLGKSGDALLVLDDWTACLSFEGGRLIGVAIERDVGRSALEFVSMAMGSAEFQFWEGPPTLDANLPAHIDPIALCARSVPARWAAELPRPEAVPCLAPASSADGLDQTRALPLARSTLAVLLEVDGRRDVRRIVWRHGLQRTLQALDELRDLRMIAYASPDVADPAAAWVPVDAALTGQVERPKVDADASPLTRAARARAVALELGQALVVTAVLVGAIHLFIQNFRVDGVSMQPTFANGEALIVDRTAYFNVESSPLGALLPAAHASSGYVFGGPRRGDVVIFRAPPQPDTDYIKRVIGLPGEAILIQNGRVSVNGVVLDEPYVQFSADYVFPGNGEPVTVPAGTYFVLGDNRPESFDSHTGWVVPEENLIGRAWIRYWPPSAWGVVQASNSSLGAPEAASGPKR